ncbi:MAG TPA: hypothetical protein DEA51_04390 [Erysipelotrichaceae bacterium]|nr:hypothetical protein [Erysipelotrichaceae bacterium]
MSERSKATLQALFVTFLWSTSWIFIKFGLKEIPALTFAGLRYTIASFVLLIWIMRQKSIGEYTRLKSVDFYLIVVYGILFISLTQGAQFLGLSYMPSVHVSLFLNLSPLVVLVLGRIFLKEKLNSKQWIGLFIFVGGIALYFYPFSDLIQYQTGMIVMTFGLIFNASATVYGRFVNQRLTLPTIHLTALSMGVGGVILLVVGFATQGWVEFTLSNWLIVLWLAVVNTALAFNLWNKSLKVLSALSANLINNTMLIQIALLSWLLLNETLTVVEWIAVALVAVGVAWVQLFRLKVKV